MNAKHRVSAPLLLSLAALSSVLLPACDLGEPEFDAQFELESNELGEPGSSPALPGEAVILGNDGQAHTISSAPRGGRLGFAWAVGETGSKCETLTLATPFTTNLDNIRIQASIDHEGSSQAGRDATTVWVEDFDASSARICVRETAFDGFDDRHEDGLKVSYRMYREADIGSHANHGISGQTAGNTAPVDSVFCTDIDFLSDSDQGQDLSSGSGTLQVQATLVHQTNNARDASSLWIKDLDSSGFTACMRETAHAGNIPNHHYGYEIDWLAYRADAEPFGGESGRASFSAKCETVSLTKTYLEPPPVFVTLDRDQSSTNAAGTVWVEDVFEDSFEVCVNGMAKLTDTSSKVALDRANISVHWAVLGPGLDCSPNQQASATNLNYPGLSCADAIDDAESNLSSWHYRNACNQQVGSPMSEPAQQALVADCSIVGSNAVVDVELCCD